MSRVFGDIFQRRASIALYLPLLFLYATSYFQRTSIPGMIFNDLTIAGLTALQISILSSAFVYTYSLTQLPVGILVDRFGGRRVVAYGGVVFCIGVLTFPFCTNPWLMYLTRIITGLGAGTLFLSLISETQRLFGRENYAVVIGFQYFIGYGGGLMGTLPFERLISVCPWRHALLGAGILSLLLYVLFLSGGKGMKGVPEQPKKPNTARQPVMMIFWKTICNCNLWKVIFSSSAVFSIYYTIQTVIGHKMLMDVTGMSSGKAAAVILSLTFICMAGLMFSSVLTKLMNNRRKPLMLFSNLLSFSIVLFFIAGIRFQLPTWSFVAAYVLLAAASGGTTIFNMTSQEVGSPATISQSAAINNMVNYLFVVGISLFCGAVLDHFMPGAAGRAVCYPREAYLRIFQIFSLFSFVGVLTCFSIPETKGKFCRE